MIGERFTVGSLAGFNHPGGASSRMGVEWYVYDRPYCFRVVRSFKGPGAEIHARALASLLNGV